MSYEGYVEYITHNGIYFCCDCYADEPPESRPYWVHHVDETNGIVADNPDTFAADKVEIGVPIEQWEDRGERRYRPIGPHWRKVE